MCRAHGRDALNMTSLNFFSHVWRGLWCFFWVLAVGVLCPIVFFLVLGTCAGVGYSVFVPIWVRQACTENAGLKNFLVCLCRWVFGGMTVVKNFLGFYADC